MERFGIVHTADYLQYSPKGEQTTIIRKFVHLHNAKLTFSDKSVAIVPYMLLMRYPSQTVLSHITMFDPSTLPKSAIIHITHINNISINLWGKTDDEGRLTASDVAPVVAPVVAPAVAPVVASAIAPAIAPAIAAGFWQNLWNIFSSCFSHKN